MSDTSVSNTSTIVNNMMVTNDDGDSLSIHNSLGIDITGSILNLNFCRIVDWDMNSLVQTLQDPSCRIVHLKLQKNEIGDTDIQALAEALQYKSSGNNTTLGWMDLTHSNVRMYE